MKYFVVELDSGLYRTMFEEALTALAAGGPGEPSRSVSLALVFPLPITKIYPHDYRLAVEPLLMSPMVRRLTSESANKASMSSITSSAENSSPSSPSVQR